MKDSKRLRPRPRSPRSDRRAQVAVLTDPGDEPARRTIEKAVAREGWKVAAPRVAAACAVVVWSPTSVGSGELAAAARPFLDRQRLLQVLLLPRSHGIGDMSPFEPPEPFTYYQGLVVEYRDLDGSDRAVDLFGIKWEWKGQQILRELARLGGLKRPRDRWNAKVEFWKPHRRNRIDLLTEYSADDGRVLRRVEPFSSSLNEHYQTTIGNRWEASEEKTGQILAMIDIDQEDMTVDLPEGDPWWKRLFRG
jgi:hypothetical protein